MNIHVVYVINVSTQTRTYWCYITKVSKLTTQPKCDNKKLFYFIMYVTKNLSIKLCGAISSTNPIYCFKHFNNCCITLKQINKVTNGAIQNIISVYNVFNCTIYKVTIDIILELRLILVTKYPIQISYICIHTPSDHKDLKLGAKYFNSHCSSKECIRNQILVLNFTKDYDRFNKVKISLLGDLKSHSNVCNEIWAGYTNDDLAGEMLTVRGYCNWGTKRYIKHSCKTSKIIHHKYNKTIEFLTLNNSTSKKL